MFSFLLFLESQRNYFCLNLFIFLLAYRLGEIWQELLLFSKISFFFSCHMCFLFSSVLPWTLSVVFLNNSWEGEAESSRSVVAMRQRAQKLKEPGVEIWVLGSGLNPSHWNFRAGAFLVLLPWVCGCLWMQSASPGVAQAGDVVNPGVIPWNVPAVLWELPLLVCGAPAAALGKWESSCHQDLPLREWIRDLCCQWLSGIFASVNFPLWRINHVHLPEKQECFDFYLVLPAKLKIPLQPHPQEYLQKLQAFTETT